MRGHGPQTAAICYNKPDVVAYKITWYRYGQVRDTLTVPTELLWISTLITSRDKVLLRGALCITLARRSVARLSIDILGILTDVRRCIDSKD